LKRGQGLKMAPKRNRITAEMSQTIAESSPLIKKTKVVAQEDIKENNIVEVKLSQLQENPFQPRINVNVQSLNELISSIEQNGLMQPIVITQMKESDLYTIVAGHRRYEAYKIMGKDNIDAIIKKDLADKDLAILSLTENLMRENLHPIENAIAIKNILDNSIVESQNKLAQYVGLSKGYVSKLMSILRLPTKIIQKVKSENYTDINILILLNRLEDENQMAKVLDEIKNLNRSDAEKYIKKKYFSKKDYVQKFIDIKKSKSKISIDIDIKQLSKEQIDSIDKKIEELNNEIVKLSNKMD